MMFPQDSPQLKSTYGKMREKATLMSDDRLRFMRRHLHKKIHQYEQSMFGCSPFLRRELNAIKNEMKDRGLLTRDEKMLT